MARNKGTFQFAANFEVKNAAALDPRVVVATKSDLIVKETWPYDGDTIYLYKGILVAVQDEKSVYMLIDPTKILDTEYNGWLRVDAGNAKQVEVIDNLTSEDTDKALSANQGKVLMTEITGVKNKLVNIYTYKGSKQTYAELPTNAVAGDVWNVAEAYGKNPAGTNYAWVAGIGEETGYWDALGGSIDLSNYLTKSEVEAAIKVETDRATTEEKRLAGLIDANTKAAAAAQNLASSNQSAIASVSTSVGNINLILNGNDDDTDDIPDQKGLITRLKEVEDILGQPEEGETSTVLERLDELEKQITTTAGDGEESTLLDKVNTNTANITILNTTVYGENGTGGLKKSVQTLTGNSTTVGSVAYQISQALQWTEIK